MATLKNTTINDTGFLQLPTGTLAQRPGTASAGMIRHNTSNNTIECHDGYTWFTVSSVGHTKDSLVIHVDAGISSSYSGSGSTWYDLTGNGYHFTLQNSPTYNSAGYFTFNGSNQWARANVDNIIRSHAAWTFNSWFYYSTSTSGADFSLMTQPNYSDTNDGYWQHFNISGSWLWRTEDAVNGEKGGTVAATPFATGNWYFLTTIVKNNSLIYYINGAYYTAITPGGFAWSQLRTDSSTAYLDIGLGYAGSSNYYFNGIVSQFTVYNKELSASEILQNYNWSRLRYGK